jgi:ElaA protein
MHDYSREGGCRSFPEPQTIHKILFYLRCGMQIHWYIKPFTELTPYELYAMLQLRLEVFVVEQNCVFQDCDNKDQRSLHLMGWHENTLAAYTRLVPPGISFTEPSIGRVVTAPAYRKLNLGRELMNRSVAACHHYFGEQPIRIGAQLYLKNFYESLGFARQGEVYLEDGIEHIYMLHGA